MIRVKPFKVDFTHIYIKCPFCGRTHYHGSCGGKNYAGSRVAHCGCESREYYIEDIGEAE
jgi:hypothetical protein